MPTRKYKFMPNTEQLGTNRRLSGSTPSLKDRKRAMRNAATESS